MKNFVCSAEKTDVVIVRIKEQVHRQDGRFAMGELALGHVPSGCRYGVPLHFLLDRYLVRVEQGDNLASERVRASFDANLQLLHCDQPLRSASIARRRENCWRTRSTTASTSTTGGARRPRGGSGAGSRGAPDVTPGGCAAVRLSVAASRGCCVGACRSEERRV